MKIRTESEHDIQTAVLQLLAAHRYFAMRINTGGFGGSHKGKKWFVKPHNLGSGCADVLVFVPLEVDGWQPMWLEVKKPGGKQSAEQKSFQEWVQSHGHRYALVFGVDDLLRELKL